MTDYDRLIRECFWDLNIAENDIKHIISGDNRRSKKQLFEKILLNSSRFLLDLRLFDRNELLLLLNEYKPPQFNCSYAFRRKNIAEVYFFDKELEIDELKWTA